MRLFILGQEIELNNDGKLTQTKQVNDINSLSTRQTNYTNSFSILRTAKNIRTFDGLGIIGNDSNIPYQKNVASLFSDSGECFVFEGWAVISDTAKDFKCNIYDGNLEVYKAIENKTLSDLNLTALSHSKTTSEVVSTFDNSKPYKYILADYNGKALYDTDKINIDYLVPSVKASWLVSQIEAYSGFTFNGSFKTNPEYTNLWLTYPKGTPSDLGTTDIFTSVDLTPDISNLKVNSYSLMTGLTLTNANSIFNALENNSVKIEINCQFILSAQDRYGDQYWTTGTLYLEKNGDAYPMGMVGGGNSYVNSYAEINTTLNINDNISFYVAIDAENPIQIQGSFYNIKIKKYNSLSIDFLDELKGFTMRDFLNEIVWRFGSTLFKEKYSNVYEFKTISQITDPAIVLDWSDKFVSNDGEKYIFGSYAQANWMRYKYNDDNANYNDGFLSIDNKNLDDTKTIIQSKIYSPELSFSNSLGFSTKVYKLWDKESKDDGTTTYKPLANRFYFIRSLDKTFDAAVTIGSESLITSQTITVAPTELFTGLTFNEIIATYYPDIKKILNKSLVLNCKLNLKDTDVSDVDFSRTYYFKQLGGNFMINKISNFIPGKETAVELIRINNL